MFNMTDIMTFKGMLLSELSTVSVNNVVKT